MYNNMIRYTQNNFKEKVVFKIVCSVKQTHKRVYEGLFHFSKHALYYICIQGMYICIPCIEKHVNSGYPWTVGL